VNQSILSQTVSFSASLQSGGLPARLLCRARPAPCPSPSRYDHATSTAAGDAAGLSSKFLD
jgi:hypothetical protein